jgi:hypothetical protein
VAEFLEKTDMIVHKDAARHVLWDWIEQRNDEDLDGQPSSVECLMYLCEVFSHAGTVVEQA